MSSTPAIDIPTSVALSVSPNAPSPSSVFALSSSVHIVSLLTSVTTSPTPSNSAPVTSAFLQQSHQSSSVLQITMTTTRLATTTIPLSASSFTPSTAVSPTSVRVLPVSSSTPSAEIITSNGNRSQTTSTFAQPTTLSTTTTTGSTQSPTSTLSHAPTVISTATPISTPTPNTPSTTTSSLSRSSPLPLGSPGRVDTPLYEFALDIQFKDSSTLYSTTVLESTTIFITSTNSQGQMMITIPPVVTEVITTTGSDGIVATITQAVVNPTLAPNSRTTGTSLFFNNTGAVVGVFVVVGLASASIMMWILFAIRHRQRMRRIEQDTAVEAAVAAAGLNRAPLDDGDEDDSPISPNSRHRMSGMARGTLRGSDSPPTSAHFSATLADTMKDSLSSHPGCQAVHRANSHPDGYAPARTTSPSSRAERYTDDPGSSRDRKSSYAHTPTYSAGSFEPLLANYLQNTPDQDTSALTTQSPRNSFPQHLGSGLVLNVTPEDGSKASSKRQNSSDNSVLRDGEDYTRCVLMVRNVPDDQSQHST